MLYELYLASYANGKWNAYSGAKFNLSSNAMRPNSLQWTSADAAGLPIFPGLVLFEQMQNNEEINHAIRMTIPSGYIRDIFAWPATHCTGNDNVGSSCDGSRSDRSSYPPMGTRFRMKACVDETRFSPQVQKVIRALKKYGAIIADGGSSWYLSGAPHVGFQDGILVKQFYQLLGKYMEAVDVSSLKVSPTSYATNAPPASIPAPAPTMNYSYPICRDIVRNFVPKYLIGDRSGRYGYSANGIYCMDGDGSSSNVGQCYNRVSSTVAMCADNGEKYCDLEGYGPENSGLRCVDVVYDATFPMASCQQFTWNGVTNLRKKDQTAGLASNGIYCTDGWGGVFEACESCTESSRFCTYDRYNWQGYVDSGMCVKEKRKLYTD